MTPAPRAQIGKLYRFEAAHQLPNHDGKCARLHGHSYEVEIVLEGPVQGATGASDEGMVVDFAVVSASWKRLHAELDHHFLNDVLPERYLPTTAENIARFILDELRRTLAQVVGVRVWETATSWAEASA